MPSESTFIPANESDAAGATKSGPAVNAYDDPSFLKALSWSDKGDGQPFLPPTTLWQEFLSADDANDVAREPRPVREIVAETHILTAMPARIKRKLAAGAPIVVVIETVSPQWSGALAEAARAIWSAHVVAEEATKTERQITLKTDGPIIAVAADLMAVSSRIASTADATIRIAPNVKAVGLAIEFVCGSRARVRPKDVEGLEPDDLVFAIRRGMTPRACVERLRRLSTVDKKTTDPAPVVRERLAPDLDQLVGYGAALGELRAVAADVARFKANEIAAGELPSLLLYGPPGTGKTTLVRSFAETVGLPLHSTSVSAWFQVGDGALGGVSKNAKKFFEQVIAAAPCVAFLDELDALPDRAALDARGRDWWTPLLTGILLLIDKVRAEKAGVVLFAATNHVKHIDRALKRPGRFDRHVEILGPRSPKELAEVLRHHLGDDLPNLDLVPFVRLGHGATGAMAEGWAKAARRAARAADRPMTPADLAAAIAPPDARSPAKLRMTALHEAGHAVVARALGLMVPSVGIIQTDDAGGATAIEGVNGALSRSAIEARVVAILAGRAADETLSGGPTSGAAMDLAQSTTLLFSVHGVFGLGERLSSVGPEASSVHTLALDGRLRLIVENELQRLMDEARRLVTNHEQAVRRLADLLLAQRVASMSEIDQILKAERTAISSADAEHRPKDARPATDALRISEAP